MTASGFPCHACGDPFATREELETHWLAEAHAPWEVADSATQRARESVGADVALLPAGTLVVDGVPVTVQVESREITSHDLPDGTHVVDEVHVWRVIPQSQRRRLRVLRGGK